MSSALDRLNDPFQTAPAPTVITGQVDSSGNLVAGSGFTPARTSAGLYTVTFATAFASNPTVVATVAGANQNFPEITVIATTGFTIRTITTAGAFQDTAFNFIAHQTA